MTQHCEDRQKSSTGEQPSTNTHLLIARSCASLYELRTQFDPRKAALVHLPGSIASPKFWRVDQLSCLVGRDVKIPFAATYKPCRGKRSAGAILPYNCARRTCAPHGFSSEEDLESVERYIEQNKHIHDIDSFSALQDPYGPTRSFGEVYGVRF